MLKMNLWVAYPLAVALGASLQLGAEADAPRPARPDTKTNQLLAELEKQWETAAWKDPWAASLKAIVDLGPEAVPDLVTELETTDNDRMLRSLGFILRAIGDKRAVPALIRAIPKTLRPAGSDYGATAEDKELLAFMQRHDLDEFNRDGQFGFGRPVREVCGALAKLTGTEHRESEIYGVFLKGNRRQQELERQLYQRCAERWAKWWEEHWNEHVEDAKLAKVELPDRKEELFLIFPHGSDFQFGSRSSGALVEPDDGTAKHFVVWDLDTGRGLPLPKRLSDLPDGAHRLDAIQDWAATEGFDLMGTLHKPEGGERAHYVIRGLGLNAWEIRRDRWDTIAAEISRDEHLPVGRPAGGLLMHFDPKRETYEPEATATFLFLTREGAYGVLLLGVEALDTNVKIGERVTGEQALNPVAFMKGRRFSYGLVEAVDEAVK
jgi:hypothetical protein